MIPLFILLISFAVALPLTWVAAGTWDLLFGGNLAMSVMLFFTGMAHFKFPEGMAMMIPSFLPHRKWLVYLSGLFELLTVPALLIPAVRQTAGVLLLIFFVVVLPANIWAAVNKVDYEKANNQGKGLAYLWFRIPLQLFFIAWVWWFSIHHGG